MNHGKSDENFQTGPTIHNVTARKRILDRHKSTDPANPAHRQPRAIQKLRGDERLPPPVPLVAGIDAEVKERFDEFYRRRDCGNIYWPGSRFARLRSSLRIVSRTNMDNLLAARTAERGRFAEKYRSLRT